MAVLAQPVIAQELVLEEVIVTAQKRTESLQDVPISVNAVSGAKMEEAGITNLQGMTAYVPNLTMNQAGIGTIIAIRGISSGINQGFEQSVGQYIDGVYYGRAQLARAPYMDLERVEVLRGPQSILFGKNSIAGAFDTEGRFMEVINPTELPGGTPYAAVLSALTGGQYMLDTEQDFKRQSNGDFSNNDTLGLMVTLTLLQSSEMSVPSTIYGVLMFGFGFMLAAYGRRVVPGEKKAGEGDSAAVAEAGRRACAQL